LRAADKNADASASPAANRAADIQIPARAADVSAPPSVEADAPQTASQDNANPYAIIVDRNVFRLVPIPPPPAPAPPPIDVPQVNLSGFRKTAKDIWVYLAMKPKDPKEGWQYFSMREGDKAGKDAFTLELVKVHADEGTVDIVNSGQPMSLSLKSNSFASAPSSPVPGGRAGENMMRRRMGMAPAGAPPAAAIPYTPPLKSGSGVAVGLSSDNTVVNAGAQSIPQAQNYANGASYGAQPSYYGSGGTQVAGAAPQITAPNGAAIDLNPSVPQRTPPAQANWPPQAQASEAEQAAALLLHEAAGGPPAPPIPGVNAEEPGAGPPAIPVNRFGPR